MAEQGFFSALLDLSFGTFITRKLIRAMFLLGAIFGGIGAVVAVLGAFGQGGAAGVVALIVAPIGYLIYLIVLRVYCEVFIVIFAIAEDLEEIRRGINRLSGGPPNP